jgi:1-acyl-sn-glycerol-3-phosphate acyltransferase
MQDSDSPRIGRLSATRRGGRSGAPRAVLDVSRRLTALERQVEEALASAGAATALPSIEAVLDGVLGTADRLRRAVSGEPEARAELIETPLDLLYRWWWRVDVVGAERLPRRGPVLVVANRAGTLLPYEAFMLARAFSLLPTPRTAHPLLDEWLLALPVLGGALQALGAAASTVPTLRQLLAAGDVAITFPESPEVVGKPASSWYRLAAFRRAHLLRVALDVGAPIVPVAVIGAEETQPVLWRIERLGRLLGLPSVPVTPAFIPLPTKWTLHVGETIDPPATPDPRALRAWRARVRERLQGLVSDGVRRRSGLFA